MQKSRVSVSSYGCSAGVSYDAATSRSRLRAWGSWSSGPFKAVLHAVMSERRVACDLKRTCRSATAVVRTA